MLHSRLRSRLNRSKSRYRTWYRSTLMNRFSGTTRRQLGSIVRDVAAHDPNNFGCLLQYIQFVNVLAQEESLECGLELGAGYSTLLYQLLFPDGNQRMYVVDANPVKLRQIGGRNQQRRIEEQFTVIKDLTITAADYDQFYAGDHDVYAGMATREIASRVGRFLVPYAGNYGPAARRAGFGEDQAPFFDAEGRMSFDPELISNGGRFEREMRFARDHGPDVGALDRLLERESSFDFIFFDCSEYSSMIEFEKLAGRIRVGGLAIFHDIYFPKSLKNFIPCTVVATSDGWEIIYQDRTTPQGLLIARKVA